MAPSLTGACSWTLRSALALFLAPPLFAETYPRDANLRELCRQKVAGQHLSLYDAERYAAGYVEKLSSEEKKLRTALITKYHGQQKLLTALTKTEADPALSNSAEEGSSLLRSLWQQLDDVVAMKHRSEKSAAKAAKELAAFRERMLRVFEIKTIAASSLGYAIHVDYRHGCPRFRVSCPLPRSDAAALAQVFAPGEEPEVCSRYRGYSEY